MKFRRLLFGTVVSDAAMALIACGSDGPTTVVVARDTSAGSAAPSEYEPAHIELVEVDISDGVPVEYIALVIVIQPNSCGTFAHVQTRHEPPASIIEAIN